jgi:putative ABC transport system substrate-binding protein
MITHLRSWRHRFAIAAVLATSAFVCGPAWGQAAPYSKWFKYDAGIGKEWDVVGDPNNPMVVSINRKDGVGPVRRVLVLYPRASSAYDTAITEILRTFSDKEINASFDVINFELNDAKGKASLSAAEQNRTELVFGMGSESVAWLYQNYMKGKLPVVTVCAKDPVQLGQMKDYDTGSGNNFAFTSLNVPVDVQMSYVRDLRPDLKNIAVLVDSKNISAVQTQAEPVANYLKEKGVEVIIGSVQNPANARQELVKIVGDAVRKMRQTDPDLSKSLFWVTGSTSVFREIRTINEHADRVPVVSVVPEIVTKGADTAVLAIGVSFESNARLAGIYGAQILNGAKVDQMKVGLVSPPDIAISFLKARDIGMRVPFNFFEIASYVYDYNGAAVRSADPKATN